MSVLRATVRRRLNGANDINVMNIPVNSPDLNLIEHIWDLLEQKVRSPDIQIINMIQMREVLQNTWNNITQNVIKNGVNMCERIEAVLKALYTFLIF